MGGDGGSLRAAGFVVYRSANLSFTAHPVWQWVSVNPYNKERTVKTIDEEQTQLINGLAIDVIDAYTLAYEVVSDLSSIFEALDNLERRELSNERIARILSRAGLRHAREKIELIDQKIADANSTFEELREE
jgi:hypothetical protein